uniref:Solute carrier family 22 member 7-like n=1 Tax=Sphaeramia orbicularis TaxID=375764 RepID=A0A672YJY7_9TELE
MKFDNILSDINGFGKFQIRLMLIQIFGRMCLPCHFLLNNFMAAVPSHHCDVSGLDDGHFFGNLTLQQKHSVGIPKGQDGTLSPCRMFAEPQYQYLSASNSTDDAFTVPCRNGWTYDNSTFKSTLATEWDLVCSRKGMNQATATIFFIGVMIGGPLFGFLSDRFGRRPLLLVSYLSSMTFSVLSAFSTTYVLFAIMRLFTGMSLAGISIISIVLNVEWFGIEHRTFCGVIISLDWTIGNWLLVGIAYFVTDWRMLVLAVTSPLIAAVLVWRWIPESARWLMTNGKVNAAHYYITQCAVMNNRSTSMKLIILLLSLNFFQRYIYCKKLCFLSRFGVAFTYYGISLNITGFGLNPYLTQLMFASIEVPMKIGVYFCLEKLGRKLGNAGALLSTGLCLFINIFITQDKWVARTTVAVLGKALSEAAFTIMYLYTTELYPTVVRQNGVGYTALVARLGVSVSPLIMLLEDVWHLLPAVSYCAVALVCGSVALLLPETLNTRLPEFIEDIEKPKRQQVLEEEALVKSSRMKEID